MQKHILVINNHPNLSSRLFRYDWLRFMYRHNDYTDERSILVCCGVNSVIDNGVAN